MKRALTLIAAAVLVVALLIGCGMQEAEPAAAETTAEIITTEEITAQEDATEETASEIERATATTATTTRPVTTSTTRMHTTCLGRVHPVECLECGSPERGCLNECIRECRACGYTLQRATTTQQIISD